MATPESNPDGTIEGISYEEPVGSGSFSFGDGQARGERIFHIDYSDRVEFVKALLGYVQGTDNQFRVIRQTFPGYPFLVCQSVSVEPLKPLGVNSDGTPNYAYAVVTASYGQQEEGDQDQDSGSEEDRVLATQELSFSTEVLEMNAMKLKWTADPGLEVPDDIPAAIIYPIIQHKYTQTESPTNNRDRIAAAVGKVNSAAIAGVGIGKLLFVGASVSREISANGERPWRIEYNFAERQEKWEKFYNTNTKAWDTVKDAATGNAFAPYQSTDFSSLLGNI